MSLAMEEQSQPVFRDFLGSNPEAKQPEMSATDSVRVSQNSGFMEQEDGEASVRGGSTFSAAPSGAPGPSSFPASSDPAAEIWRHPKAGPPFNHAIKPPHGINEESVRKRDEYGNRGQFRDNPSEAIEGSRPNKVSRFKQREGDALPNTGDLCLTMQPPRTQAGNSLWLQSAMFKPDPSAGVNKRLEPSRTSTGPGGVPMMSRPAQVTSGAAPSATAGGMFSRNPASSMQPPPADEGSRTGLQGGGIAALINNANVKLPPSRPVGEPSALERAASLDRPKLPLQNGGGSESMLPSHKTATTSVTRQLTIFYGGHAHVFDDVSPDKADAIMQLAGSNGRSWSTTYAHRSSRSEGSLIDLERRRDKPVNGSTSSLGIPADMQNVLHGMNHGGLPRKHHRLPPDLSAAKLPGDVQAPSGSAVGEGNRFALANGRAAGHHSPFYNIKEAASNGQHWL